MIQITFFSSMFLPAENCFYLYGLYSHRGSVLIFLEIRQCWTGNSSDVFHVEHYSIVKVNSDVFVENSPNCVLQSMWASFSPHDGVAIIAVVAFGKMLLIQ